MEKRWLIRVFAGQPMTVNDLLTTYLFTREFDFRMLFFRLYLTSFKIDFVEEAKIIGNRTLIAWFTMKTCLSDKLVNKVRIEFINSAFFPFYSNKFSWNFEWKSFAKYIEDVNGLRRTKEVRSTGKLILKLKLIISKWWD
jgi:hypothetical protein